LKLIIQKEWMQLVSELPKVDLAKNCPKFKVSPFQLDKSADKD
jgi:hypothetical protein